MIGRVLSIPAKRFQPARRDLPHRRRVPSVDRRATARPLGRPPRPRDADPHDPGGPTGLGTRRRQLRRHHPRHRRLRASPGQRTQTPGRSAHPRSQRRSSTVWIAERGGHARGPAVPDPHRPPTQSRRRRAPRRHPRRDRRPSDADHSKASESIPTSSGITWTAGLCGRLACFPCWACRGLPFRPHNPGGYRQIWSSHSRRSRSAVQLGRGSGVSDS